MDTIVVMDFGGQYSHLIGRRIRDMGVYAEVVSPGTTKRSLEEMGNLKGVILSGGAASVYAEDSPKPERDILDLEVPILGICYGHQLLAHMTGGDVESGDYGEYGTSVLGLSNRNSKLLRGLDDQEEVWMNHKDRVAAMPVRYSTLASTDSSPIAAFVDDSSRRYGVQFHPEVTHTSKGGKLLENFALSICNAERDWDPSGLAPELVGRAEDYIGNRKAIIGLSGGVDSTTAARLVGKAIGDDLTAIYVDTGLMRQGETESIKNTFTGSDLELIVLNRKEEFLGKLEGVEEPEKKRKIIGNTFIDVFTEKAKSIGAEVLVQGTIYSDVIESGSTTHSDTIKSHHNVGGLPEKVNLDIYEPLKDLYKDEVRQIADSLGLPEEIINRHVFPGPGLAIRIVGEVTPARVEVVRRASYIVEEELKSAGLYEDVWMGFAVLLSVKSVGIQGDLRSYKYPVALRIVESEDAMTANFAQIPFKILEKMSTRITNELDQVNRVVYDISNKPPATMEWE
ncbi:glutamine-hydrolyzing GMP synthase [Candidatus Bipolaricaulota bacterium]|nr:glutamine-hydrolyzing GMP synthase [Candidatus Bipolaricaulota bacterium]